MVGGGAEGEGGEEGARRWREAGGGGKGWWWWWWWWGLGVQFCGETVGTGQGSRSARVCRARWAHNPMGMGTCAPRAVPPFAPGLTPLTIPGRCWG